MYAVWIGGGYLAGHLWMQHRKNYFAERDALMRHYIQLHPEDFPPPGNQNITLLIYHSSKMNCLTVRSYTIHLAM